MGRQAPRRSQDVPLVSNVKSTSGVYLCSLLSGTALQFFLKLLLKGFKVEARALLHWRELEQGLCCLRNFVLHKYEPPELIGVPIVKVDRLVKASSTEGAQP